MSEDFIHQVYKILSTSHMCNDFYNFGGFHELFKMYHNLSISESAWVDILQDINQESFYVFVTILQNIIYLGDCIIINNLPMSWWEEFGSSIITHCSKLSIESIIKDSSIDNHIQLILHRELFIHELTEK